MEPANCEFHYIFSPTNPTTGCQTFLIPADRQTEFQMATESGTSSEIILIIYVI